MEFKVPYQHTYSDEYTDEKKQKVTDSAKNRTLCSILRAVKTKLYYSEMTTVNKKAGNYCSNIQNTKKMIKH